MWLGAKHVLYQLDKEESCVKSVNVVVLLPFRYFIYIWRLLQLMLTRLVTLSVRDV